MGKRLGLIALAVVLVLGVGACSIGSVVWGSYNKLTVLSEKVNSQWADVETVYQRRVDLVPNLVETVRGYAIHENETLTAVTEARAKIGQINVNAGQVTPQMLAQFQSVQGELSSALSRLMVVVEKYPDLKASTLFGDLMVQMEGTENRISVERNRYNEIAREYNATRNVFPTNIIASWFKFEQFAELK